jgi:hypothetical protein
MNESDLREHLRDLVADQPMMRHGSVDDLRLGRRTRTPQPCAAAWWPLGSQPADVPVAASSGGGLVERCTRVDKGALDPEVFGPGSRVVVSDSAGTVTQLVIVSGDATSWASCHLEDDLSAEFNGYAETFPMNHSSDGGWETAGYSWGHGVFWYYDRFPTEVAEVELRFREGPTLTRQTVDGFVVAVVEDPKLNMQWDGSVLFTLRDADGDVLGRTGGWPELGRELTLPRRYWTLVPRD